MPRESGTKSRSKPTATAAPADSTAAVGVCVFERSPTDVKGSLAHAKAETLKRGGSWEGDMTSGRYLMRTPLGAIEGTYAMSHGKVRFVVERKPALVPCALISAVIDQFITS